MKTCARCKKAKPISAFYDRPGYCRACRRKITLDWRARNPRKRFCHQQVAGALRNGLTVRPNACEVCKTVVTVVAHHPDYRSPKRFVWVCDKCHGAIHAGRIEIFGEVTKRVIDFREARA